MSNTKGTARPTPVDVHVGKMMRRRRIMLGLTQQELAEKINVTYQQQHKREKGINRVSASALYNTAQALETEPGWFFEGLGQPARLDTDERRTLELVRNYHASSARDRRALETLARDLAEPASTLQAVVAHDAQYERIAHDGIGATDERVE